MRLSLDALATLDAIARKGSFAAAAEELHRVPSAVTYVVQKLEHDLGLLIFDRSGHRARLTPEGTELLREALDAGRAELVIGVSGDAPAEGGCSMLSLGNVRFVFAVAPSHPLARLPEPLAPNDILAHRAVLAADSARHLPPRTTGILAGQDRLTVPSVRAKLAAQVAGLGVGYLPTHVADPEIAAGRLVARAVAEPKPSAELFAAWHNRQMGKALEWFIGRLGQAEVRAGLLG